MVTARRLQSRSVEWKPMQMILKVASMVTERIMGERCRIIG